MDAAGSRDLAELHAAQRRRRVLGIAGAVLGFMMTAERAKIAEARARIEQTRSAAAG